MTKRSKKYMAEKKGAKFMNRLTAILMRALAKSTPLPNYTKGTNAPSQPQYAPNGYISMDTANMKDRTVIFTPTNTLNQTL
jgi:hypothetical protein